MSMLSCGELLPEVYRRYASTSGRRLLRLLSLTGFAERLSRERCIKFINKFYAKNPQLSLHSPPYIPFSTLPPPSSLYLSPLYPQQRKRIGGGSYSFFVFFFYFSERIYIIYGKSFENLKKLISYKKLTSSPLYST